MFLVDFLFVLVIVAVLTAVFSAGFARHRGPSLFGFFLILLLLTWATGIWIAPIGYPVWGGYWVSFLITGILFALLLMALIPPARSTSRRVEGESPITNEYVLFGAFFWTLLVVLILIIIAGYVVDPFPEIAYRVPVD